MTTQEVQNALSIAPNQEWFTGVEVHIKYPNLKYENSIKGFSAVYEFVNQQFKGWESLVQIPSELQASKTYFESIRNYMVSIVQNYANSDVNTLNGQWQWIIQQFNNRNNSIFLYDSPETEFLNRVYKELPSAFPSAYGFLINTFNINNAGKDNLIGILLAYEFTLKDFSEITERRNTEKSSISRLRNRFENYLTVSEQHVVSVLNETNNKYVEFTQAIDQLKSEKEAILDRLFEETKKDFSLLNLQSTQQIQKLHTTYNELLRLKEPAEYWKSRADTLKKEGWTSLYWLIGLIGFACLTLYFLLWLTPEGMLLSFIRGDASALKWSIIYVTFISFLAFGIRAVNKVTFSSFHLARDAEERQQLTHVYLAMIKDANVDEKDRHLIMQSLFSRADTGLLKDDSSPTMPGVVDRIFSK